MHYEPDSDKAQKTPHRTLLVRDAADSTSKQSLVSQEKSQNRQRVTEVVHFKFLPMPS